MELIKDLSELRIGEPYLIEVLQKEYNEDEEEVEIKYKFKGTYSGIKEPIVKEDDGFTELTPEDMKYEYCFSPYSEQVYKKSKYIFVQPDVENECSFPLEIPGDKYLRISQDDVIKGTTKVYLSTQSEFYKNSLELRRVFDKKEFPNDISRYTKGFLGGKTKKRTKRTKRIKRIKRIKRTKRTKSRSHS
jgi:hypothetical protein